MAKLDMKRELRHLYAPPKDQPVVVDVPQMSFLMIDGRGDPSTSAAYMEAIEALFMVSYSIKFTVKRREPERDYTVMPLESLWWSDGQSESWLEDRGAWSWTAMIAQPPVVTEKLVRRAVAGAGEKKDLPALAGLRFEIFREGLSVQILHVGAYEAELPTIEKLHAFIAEHDYPMRGNHHEIYLSDPHRTPPDRLKTVIRQPIGV